MFVGPIGIDEYQNDSLHLPTESRQKDSVIDSTVGIVPNDLDQSKQILDASLKPSQDKSKIVSESHQEITAKNSSIQKDSILIEVK